MPIYEYTCTDCGTTFEVVRSIKDADVPIPCKHCEGLKTTRQISVFFAQSGGRTVAGSGPSCSGCSSSSCAGCKN